MFARADHHGRACHGKIIADRRWSLCGEGFGILPRGMPMRGGCSGIIEGDIDRVEGISRGVGGKWESEVGEGEARQVLEFRRGRGRDRLEEVYQWVPGF